MRFTNLLMQCAALLACATIAACDAPEAEDIEIPTEPINEMVYRPEATAFALWSPAADGVTLRLYKGDDLVEQIAMQRAEHGLWRAVAEGDRKGEFYTFQVSIDGKELPPTAGIFAKAVAANGDMGAIIDLRDTDPEGWAEDCSPKHRPSDMVIYEMHYRDMTAHASAGVRHVGKYLGMAEHGTRSAEGLATGIDHLCELGITHLHLLPTADYGSIDELDAEGKYNWGYEPKNFNVPEGTYATDACTPEVRIRELKTLIQALHKAGISVVLDVVYNHTTVAENCGFERTMPGYFYRMREDGTFADGSGCGNETASNKPMMRKYMVESLEYWVREYHIDGFRFDLMAIHDIETMKLIRERLSALNPDILLYGEGWAANQPLYDESKLAFKRYTYQMPGVAAFSDDIRNALRGTLDLSKGGFIHGVAGNKEALKFGIVGGVEHPEVHHSEAAWCAAPTQHISYVTCHDDHNLRDRLEHLSPEASEEELLKMDKLAQFGVFVSQGIPFFFSGEELFRTKLGEKNTYNMPDKYNAIDWGNKARYADLVEYYKGLIAMRKAHPAFALGTAEAVREHLSFIESDNEAAVGFVLDKLEGIDPARRIVVLMNGSRESVKFDIPEGNYRIVADGERIIPTGGDAYNSDGTISVAPISGVVLAAY